MEKEIIASSNSIKGLERLLCDCLNEPVSVDGKHLKNKSGKMDGFTVKQNGNIFVCYKEQQKSKIDAKIEERNRLMISKENPERLKQLISEINYFEYGIS